MADTVKPVLTALEMAAAGNVIGAIGSLAASFLSIFGGGSKADKDRKAVQDNFISTIWPKLQFQLAELCESTDENKILYKIMKADPNFVKSQEYKDLWHVYNKIWLKKYDIFNDNSKSHTVGATQTYEIIGDKTQAGLVSVVVDMFNKIVARYGPDPENPPEGSLFKEEKDKEKEKNNPLSQISKNNYIYIALVIIIVVILFIKFK